MGINILYKWHLEKKMIPGYSPEMIEKLGLNQSRPPVGC